MIDRKFIMDKVWFFLKKESKFFTSSEVLSLIKDEAFYTVARDVNYPKTNYSAYLASGEYIVSTPSDFIRVSPHDKVTYRNYSGYFELEPKEKTDIGVENILTAAPALPENYYSEHENALGVYPPSLSGIVVIPYVKKPTTLSSDTDTNELTEKCYNAVVYWTVKECMLKDTDERYKVFETLYYNETSRLESLYNIAFNTPRNVTPHPDYIR